MTERRRGTYLLLPQWKALDLACEPISKGFGFGVYLVGSCMERPDYRDVDVRAILSDDDFSGMFPSADPDWPHRDPRWIVVCLSISVHLRQVSHGLPIDFQIQQQTYANREHSKRRDALGMGAWRTEYPTEVVDAG